MSCCEARATGPDTPPGGDVSIENVGGGVETYVETTGPNPFEFRTLVSTDDTIELTQNAETIDIKLNVELLNVGGFAEVYDDDESTATQKFFRTLQSSDGSVTITQNDDDIDLTVDATALETYYSSKTDIISTNNTTYVTVSTMDAVTGGAVGESWIFVCSCLVCHPSGLTTVNSRIRWQIETSAGVFTNLETDMNINEPQTIAVGQRSSPRTRTYLVTLSMATPRLRLQYSMSAAVATGGQVEYAQVSGYKR